MICGACGHWNNDDEHRCEHCGRTAALNSDSSWMRTGLEAPPAPMPVGRPSGTSARLRRHEISRRLDEYRNKQRGSVPESQAPARSDETPSQPSPNVISIDQVTADRRPADRKHIIQPASHSIHAPMARLGQRAPDLPSIPAVRREHAAESAAFDQALPPLGVNAGASEAPISADRLPAPVRRRPGGVQCDATVAPLQIRTLAGVLDLAMIVVALGTFLAVFHWFGGPWNPDNDGVRTLGIASFVLVAFYWVFYVGHFGRTPGMTWIGLQLVNFHGQKPSTTQRAARALGLILSSATLGLGFAWCLADEEKLTWHDRMSRTFLTRRGVPGFQMRYQARKVERRTLPDLPPARKAAVD